LLLFVPTFTPFTFHWNTGEDPPFVDVAVYVTGIPWHTGFTEAAMERLTGRSVLITMAIWLEIAGLPLAHVPLDVNWQDTTSPFTGL
jgi:hypothetical protein